MDGDVPRTEQLPSSRLRPQGGLRADHSGDWLGRMIAKFLVVGSSSTNLHSSSATASGHNKAGSTSPLHAAAQDALPFSAPGLHTRVRHGASGPIRDPSSRQSATSGGRPDRVGLPKGGISHTLFLVRVASPEVRATMAGEAGEPAKIFWVPSIRASAPLIA